MQNAWNPGSQMLPYNIYIYIYPYYHHVMDSSRTFLTISPHSSLSSITPERFSRLYPENCCISVLAGRSAFVRPCEGVYRSMSRMSPSLLLQQCPTCVVHLTGVVFLMGGRWLYSCSFAGSCLQDLFNIIRSILV